MKTVLITRFKGDKDHTLGFCFIKDEDMTLEYLGCTLERGFLDNKKNVSCVPAGIYNLKLEYSPKFETNLWELYGVPNRSECKFHVANYWHQLNGCIALGDKHLDIDNDGVLDVTNSRLTLDKFHKALQKQEFSQVEIIDLCPYQK